MVAWFLLWFFLSNNDLFTCFVWSFLMVAPACSSKPDCKFASLALDIQNKTIAPSLNESASVRTISATFGDIDIQNKTIAPSLDESASVRTISATFVVIEEKKKTIAPLLNESASVLADIGLFRVVVSDGCVVDHCSLVQQARRVSCGRD